MYVKDGIYMVWQTISQVCFEQVLQIFIVLVLMKVSFDFDDFVHWKNLLLFWHFEFAFAGCASFILLYDSSILWKSINKIYHGILTDDVVGFFLHEINNS